MHRRALLKSAIAGAVALNLSSIQNAGSARMVVIEGNSLSSNNPPAYGWPVCWPTRFAAGEFARSNRLKVVNVAVGATGLHEAFERAPLFVDPLRPLVTWGCVVLIEGGNDLAQVTYNPQVTYERTRRYCEDRRQAGWHVIVGTITNRTTVPYDAWWSQCKHYNELLRAGWREFADGLVDLANVPELGTDNAADDRRYFHDRIHYADAAMEVVRAMVERELEKLIVNTTIFFPFVPR